MPELSEVEIQCQRLFRDVVHQQITSVNVIRDNGKYLFSMGGLLNGQMILNIWRRGKVIIFQLQEGIMTCHLAMSGYWDMSDDPWTFDYVEGRRTATEKDVRVRFGFEGGRTLRFHDSRLFGSLRYHHGLKDIGSLIQINKMGPEVIQTPRMLPGVHILSQLALEYIFLGSKSDVPIKQVLMDQGKLAGLGNIYVTETLWSVKINPKRRARQCIPMAGQITGAAKAILQGAIDRNLDYSLLRCYRQKICSWCGSGIEMVKIAGRSSYFCRSCQSW